MLALTLLGSAQAGELYAGIGLPGVMLGYAQAVSDDIALRADVSALAVDRSGQRGGVDYTGTAKLVRAGLYAEWFPVAEWSFRLSGGVTFNRMRLDLSGLGNGSLVTVGRNLYLLTPADRFEIKARFPCVTPYLGIGWGHRPAGPGWGLLVDLGASIGRARVTGQARGPALSSPLGQQDFENELDGWRRHARLVPQASVGASYLF
ncbi:hypothetical protein LXT12_17925 [Pelomonas sp. P7]|uniref:Outer membrane protein beta-barrel domain-containing protein n=1 Tax=Pelomonas caseinilytica TaxID=2906763 RepID=A0ABS8XJD8_9BURK|nr:hypothetical protein [Pelomonas sp. P7]MCE4539133.1 hypothetical protein [Pelomonas sp. P7]